MQTVTSPLSGRHMFFDDSPSYKRKTLPFIFSSSLKDGSPGSCLAADLGANVHIDTPIMPTPRRSLFQAQTPAFLNLPPPNDSSTPCGVPSKKPSPSPSFSPSFSSFSPLSAGSDSAHMHRLRKNNRSTSSLRLTSAGVSFDPISEEGARGGSKPKAFRFSLELESSSSSSQLFTHSIDEADTSMDTDEDDVVGGGLGGLGGLSRDFKMGQGSPALDDTPSARPVRPSLNPLCKRTYTSSSTPFASKFKRPRRTHSMFQDPKELMQEELDEEKEMVRRLSLSPDVNNNVDSFLVSQHCQLESFSVEGDPFRRIKRETLVQILDGQYSHYYDRHVVIDCRFEYEYDGGHIDGAININSKDRLEELLTKEGEILGDYGSSSSSSSDDDISPKSCAKSCNNSSSPPSASSRTLLIFHCEYSAHRGPRMAMHLRNRDRRLNMTNYPHLNFPDVVILQGGYNHFFEQFHSRCYPPQYVEMNDSLHKSTCEREMGRFRRHMKLRSESSLNKQVQQNVSCSPVGLSRSLSENVDYHRPKRVVSCQLWR